MAWPSCGTPLSTDSRFRLTGQQAYLSSVTKHYYAVPSTTTTYYDAYNRADDTSYAGVVGHLWVPNSFGEFYDITQGYASSFNGDYVWLALSDSAVEGKWIITAGPEQGTDVSDLLWWYFGNPNGGLTESCAVHWPGYDGIGDASCGNRFRYVIEYECPFGQRFNDQGTACIGMACKKRILSIQLILPLCEQTSTLCARTHLMEVAGCKSDSSTLRLKDGTEQQTECGELTSMDTLGSPSTQSTSRT
jgi:hypothetical protein